MSDQQPAQWAPGLADAFTYQTEVMASKRALEAESKRADLAEKKIQELTGSPWWRLTAKPRALTSRIRNRRSTQTSRETGHTRPGQPPVRVKPEGKSKAPTVRSSPAAQTQMRTEALCRRIDVVLTEFDASSSVTDPQRLDVRLSNLADVLTAHSGDRALAWLSYIAVCARYPKDEQVMRFATDVQVFGAPAALAELLAEVSEEAQTRGQLADLELVRDVVVDASATSRREYHTGIQRVVRETVPRWASHHPVTLMVWAGGLNCFRPPTDVERRRIMDFRPGQRVMPSDKTTAPEKVISVPWKTTVITPEPTTSITRAEALATMSTWGGNTLSAIFYDFIMFLYPESLQEKSLIGLANYLPTIRAAARVSAISSTIAADIAHYSEIVQENGFGGPQVTAHLLPVQATHLSDADIEQNRARVQGVPGLPIVLTVSSIEPRKNQIMIMRAAERLWQEGQHFQLVIIGWGSWNADGVIAEFERLQNKGRPIRLIRRADEALLWTAFHIADFSVYVSVVEGYGLPAAESIAAGTPVVLSNLGSMAEIGAGGGALMVNPRDLNEVTDGMRTLLTDKAALDDLRRQARDREQTTWDDYADATWRWLVEGIA